jgi:hypothetical protein
LPLYSYIFAHKRHDNSNLNMIENDAVGCECKCDRELAHNCSELARKKQHKMLRGRLVRETDTQLVLRAQ